MATCCVLASDVLIGEVLIPVPQQVPMVFFDQPLYPVNLCSAEPTTTLKPGGIDPKFGLVIVTLNMDMGRLIAVTCVEEESVRANSQYSWHCPVSYFPLSALSHYSVASFTAPP
jgi:hypothetical protein